MHRAPINRASVERNNRALVAENAQLYGGGVFLRSGLEPQQITIQKQQIDTIYLDCSLR